MFSKSEVLSRLSQELAGAIPDAESLPSCTQLERLPYLMSLPDPSNHSAQLTPKHSAVISEGLRLGYGVCQRLPRVSPHAPMSFRSSDRKVWEIPAGTSMSMTSALIHTNPNIFPDPLEFRPERWIENRRLDRYLLSFSKGDRQCLGIK